MVREADDEGVCRRDVRDAYGLMLTKMRIFTGSPVLPHANTVDLMLPLAERVFIEDRRNEVFAGL